MKNVQIKHIIPMICMSPKIIIDDNNGITHYATIYGKTKNKLAMLNKYADMYVVMLDGFDNGIEIVVQEKKYF